MWSWILSVSGWDLVRGEEKNKRQNVGKITSQVKQNKRDRNDSGKHFGAFKINPGTCLKL